MAAPSSSRLILVGYMFSWRSVEAVDGVEGVEVLDAVEGVETVGAMGAVEIVDAVGTQHTFIIKFRSKSG